MKRRNSEAEIGRKYFAHDVPLADRIKAVGYTLTDAGCWEWNGGRHSGGYGVISYHGTTYRLHRLTLEGNLGRKLNSKEYACHACDNPPCMNPGHLFVGSIHDNLADMRAKGRGGHGRTGTGRPPTYPRETLESVFTLAASGMPAAEVAKSAGISLSYTYSLLSGRTRISTNR